MEEKSYKEYLEHITTFIFDVDGVLTNSMVLVTDDGELLRSMNAKDGYAIKTAIKNEFNFCIITGGTNQGVKKRLEGLGVEDIYLNAHEKINQLNDYLVKKNIKPENVLYMGDDMPDIPVMEVVGLPCCPQDAVPEVKNVAKYISHKKGGKGAARDVIEQVLKVQGKWAGNFSAKND
ncbi:3-deoxy-D-manno-octulosonate 8-phosphate phosphatase [Tamlana sedimentorum]|uniref:3-deoxy-D-manno-octulosonate 8-phosphate phosphatase n=2 Tax=Neotamlana TaxID=3400367 RepID=A0A0D7WBV8_9FLAO|nr:MULTISPECIES: HAD hydrolase family protein [Tamlana]KJD36168.1 3-deoxy-D-manno-octulosonate 8-phosphate phosphatase [Tamlana sedimentorum]MCB4797789.1 HAD hydrolase family protein [Tamlana laminarinivorans]